MKELRHIIQKMYGIAQVQDKILTYILIVYQTCLVCCAKSLLCSLITRYSEMCLACVLDVSQSHLGLGWIINASITSTSTLCLILACLAKCL